MKQYHNLLKKVLSNGVKQKNRTGVDTISIFGEYVTFDLREGFPLLTTKKVHFKGIVTELLWFLAGDTNNNSLTKEGVTIWSKWAKETGELGPIYGHQWRKFGERYYGRTGFGAFLEG